MRQISGIEPVSAGIVQFSDDLSVETAGIGFIEITQPISRVLTQRNAEEGLLTLFVRHTSASLTIQENADPDVCSDLLDALDNIAPRNAGYRHMMEGPDDMPAHIRSMITQVHLSIPVRSGKMVLGTWQGIYLIEHRDAPHKRSIALHYSGTRAGSFGDDG